LAQSTFSFTNAPGCITMNYDAPTNLPFLFAAFAVVWVVFFAYAIYMSWRRQSLERELRELNEELQDSLPAVSDEDGGRNDG
jgi:CcmD family protein